ncbi:hypothetical protein KKF84_03395 [Myxococcota bacterium]|nr:hypothetical protein [Myxococcota bacterium]MBU1534336.1 hypothetical protein [Myxococcota bacterium]
MEKKAPAPESQDHGGEGDPQEDGTDSADQGTRTHAVKQGKTHGQKEITGNQQ